MKTKGIAAFALLTVVMGIMPSLVLAGTPNHSAIQPLVGRDVGSPPPPMPVGPLTARDVGSPPPPMPVQ